MRPSRKPAGSAPASSASCGRAAPPKPDLLNTVKAWIGSVRDGVLLHLVVVLAFHRGRRRRIDRPSAYSLGTSGRSIRQCPLLEFLLPRAMTTWSGRDGGNRRCAQYRSKRALLALGPSPASDRGCDPLRTSRVLPPGRRPALRRDHVRLKVAHAAAPEVGQRRIESSPSLRAPTFLRQLFRLPTRSAARTAVPRAKSGRA